MKEFSLEEQVFQSEERALYVWANRIFGGKLLSLTYSVLKHAQELPKVTN